MEANAGVLPPDVPFPGAAHTKEPLKGFQESSMILQQKVKDVHEHIKRIGGEETKTLYKELADTPFRIEKLMEAFSSVTEEENAELASGDVKRRLRILENEFSKLLKLLRRQRQAFQHFDRLRSTLKNVRETVFEEWAGQKNFNFLFARSLVELKFLYDESTKEFDKFLDKTLPGFLYEEEERATTRYLTLTTIATFFSSVTATMLQFSFDKTDGLNRATNVCWFLSLVFSVSSGISSLLSLGWRKSVEYFSEDRPPALYTLWFNDAPMFLLAVSAVAFIVGLNVFAFASHQPHYVTFTTVAFTSALSICILLPTLWLSIRLYWSNLSFQKVRRYCHWVLCHDDQVFSVNFAIGNLECWDDKALRLPLPNGFLNALRNVFDLKRKCISGIKKIRGRTARAAEESNSNHSMEDFILSVRQTFKAPPASSTDKQRKDLKSAGDHFQTLKNHWDSETCLARDIEREGKYLLWGYPPLQRSLYAVLRIMHTEEKQRTLRQLQEKEHSTLDKSLSEEQEALLEYQRSQRVSLLEGGEAMQALLHFQGEENHLFDQYQDDRHALMKQQDADLQALMIYHVDEWNWLVDTQRKPEATQKQQQSLSENQEKDGTTILEDWKERHALLQAQWEEMHAELQDHEEQRLGSPQNSTLVRTLEMKKNDLVRCHVEEQDTLMQEHDDERRLLPFYQILARPRIRGNGFRGVVPQNPPDRQQQRPDFQERPESPGPWELRDQRRATKVAERNQRRATRVAGRDQRRATRMAERVAL